MAKIVELIYTITHRGNGTKESISRIVHQLFSKDGKLVAEYDPCVLNSPGFEFSDDTFE